MGISKGISHMKYSKTSYLVVLLACCCMALTLTACGKQAELPNKTVWPTVGAGVTAAPTASPKAAASTPTPVAASADVVFVDDSGVIDDGGYNQTIWGSVQRFASDSGQSSTYLMATESDAGALTATLEQTISQGARTVVCAGSDFDESVATLQNTHGDVRFLMVDGQPSTIAGNTHCILYHEEQAGYLAGYALVKDGYRDIGFAGGDEVAPVLRYGYGFQRGIDDAAKELGVSSDIYLTYWYAYSFKPGDDITEEVAHWYATGTSAVFSCGGSIEQSVLAASGGTGAIVGVDTDRSALGANVVTSAMKDLDGPVNSALWALKNNNGSWPQDKAGAVETFGTAQDAVGLATSNGAWRLQNFKVADYGDEYRKVKSGAVSVSADIGARPEVSYTVRWKNEPLD